MTASTIKLRANLTGNGPVRAVSDDFNDNSFDTTKWNDQFLNSTDPDTVASDALNEDFSTSGWPTNLPTATGYWQRNSVWTGNTPYSIRGGNGEIVPAFSDDFESGADLTGWTTSGAGTWSSAQNWLNPNWSMQNTRTGTGTSVATASFAALAAQGTLTFDWQAVGLPADDTLYADYSINGTDWFNVWSRVGDGTTASGTATAVVPAGTTQVRLQFVLGSYTAGEMAYWDNVIVGTDSTIVLSEDAQDNDISNWTLTDAVRWVDDFQDGSITDWTTSGGAIWQDNFADGNIGDWTLNTRKLFGEGFESGGFATNDWTTGTVQNGTWTANDTNPHSGTYNARLTTTNNGTRWEGYFQKSFDTSALTNPRISFWWAFNGSGTTDYFGVQYSTDGATWSDLMPATLTDQLTYTQATYSLPVGTTVYVRFNASVDRVAEYAWVDDVLVFED
ncbi:hypothetical protein EG835_08170, partial [bacterium]|nr:hypothetical protein [bacterium]